MRALAAALISALLATAVFAGAALGAPANYRALAGDGSVVFFTTIEELVPGDTDSRQDVYQRSFDADVGDHVTRELSTGPIGGNDAYDAFFERISADGKVLFFSTAERLVSSDGDSRSDIYVRDVTTGSTELGSTGAAGCAPGCGNGDEDVGFAGATPDGSSLLFVTEESLASADTDSAIDIYRRDVTAGSTNLVSAGDSDCSPSCGNGNSPVTLWGVSTDGSTAYFTSAESLANEDSDSADDVYARDFLAGTTALVTIGESDCLPGCGNSGAVPVYRRSSSEGSRVFFITDEALAGSDTDLATDVYRRDLTTETTELVSAGDDPNLTASFAAASADGSVAFFTTTEDVVGADDNDANDVFRWSGGGPELITSGTCDQISGCGSSFNFADPEGDMVVFTTTEQLAAGDIDAAADLYRASAPAWIPTLVSAGDTGCQPSCGNGDAPAIFNTAAAGGEIVFFTTQESLAVADEDVNADIYRRNLGTGSTTLSTPDGICPHKAAGCDSIFSGASDDGAHLVFQTDERLAAEDIDTESDVYERSSGETLMVSIGNSAAVGPATPVLTATDPPSPAASMTPRVRGQSDPETAIKVYTRAGCVGVPTATGTALDLGGGGIQVTVAVGSTTTFFVTATDVEGDTSACSPGISYTQADPEIPPPPPPPPPSDIGGGGSKSGGGKSGGSGKGGGNSIAYVAPRTLITFGPGSKTRQRRPVFRFADATEQPGTEFHCRVDHRRWHPCTSPQKLKPLAFGRHVFRVKARNAVGEWGATPVKRSFKVVR